MGKLYRPWKFFQREILSALAQAKLIASKIYRIRTEIECVCQLFHPAGRRQKLRFFHWIPLLQNSLENRFLTLNATRKSKSFSYLL